MNIFLYLAFLLFAGILSSTLFAQEHRQHGSHQHGVGRLNLAQEDTEIRLELDSPAANIVGFEYAPSSEVKNTRLTVKATPTAAQSIALSASIPRS